MSRNSMMQPTVVEVEGGEQFAEVRAFGDGNCAFNVISMMLAGHIRSGKYPDMSQDKFEEFLRAMRERTSDIVALKDYYTHSIKKDIVPLIDEFTEKFLADPKKTVTWEEFKQYVTNQKSRLQIAALQVCLAPGIRHLAHAAAVREKINADADAHKNFRNVFGEMFVLGCLVFDLEAKMFVAPTAVDQKAMKPTMVKTVTSGAGNRVPVICIHRGNHFNLLLDKETAHSPAWESLFKHEDHKAEVEHEETRIGLEPEHKSMVLTHLSPTSHSYQERHQVAFDELLAKKLDELQNTSETASNDDELFNEAFAIAVEEAVSEESETFLGFSQALDKLGFFQVRKVEAAEPMVVDAVVKGLAV